MTVSEQKILNNYLGLLERLNPKMKLSIIERLKASTKKAGDEKLDIKAAFGAWESDESAEDLIESIRSARNTNREIEDF